MGRHSASAYLSKTVIAVVLGIIVMIVKGIVGNYSNTSNNSHPEFKAVRFGAIGVTDLSIAEYCWQ